MHTKALTQKCIYITWIACRLALSVGRFSVIAMWTLGNTKNPSSSEFNHILRCVLSRPTLPNRCEKSVSVKCFKHSTECRVGFHFAHFCCTKLTMRVIRNFYVRPIIYIMRFLVAFTPVPVFTSQHFSPQSLKMGKRGIKKYLIFATSAPYNFAKNNRIEG